MLLAAPGTVAVLAPWLATRWQAAPLPAALGRLRVVGMALVVAGAAVLLDSFARFAWIGRGSPAPPLPTETLVVSGLYRYVRNPMYLAILAIVAG